MNTPDPSPFTLVDTHAHLEDFENIDEIVNHAKESNINKIITIGTTLRKSQQAVTLAQKHQEIYAAIGIHPHDAANATNKDLGELQKLAEDPKVVAIGEGGLDYHYNFSPKQDQLGLFKKLIGLANKLNKPFIVHTRQAIKDTLQVLRETPPLHGFVVHCFSESLETAKEIFSMGGLISVGGIITFKKSQELRETIKEITIDKILLETDTPYLCPEPFRGKTNQPANVDIIAKGLAQIKNVNVAEIAQKTTANAKALFNI